MVSTAAKEDCWKWNTWSNVQNLKIFLVTQEVTPYGQSQHFCGNRYDRIELQVVGDLPFQGSLAHAKFFGS